MEATTLYREGDKKKINSQLLSLWIGMASIVMLFGAFTSAYMVKQGSGNWLQFSIPNSFLISTTIIIISSVFLHLGYNAFKQRLFSKYRNLLLLTTLLGYAFIVLQYIGWTELFANGVDLKANVGGSFFYLITGTHAAHVLGGITVLTVSSIYAFSMPLKYTEVRRNRVEMVLHFWHFLGALWVYLFLFLNIIR